MKLRETIDELMPIPGCFAVFEDQHVQREASKSETAQTTAENKEAALAVFHKSKSNSRSLLDEAQFLREKGFYSRAVALAIMSYEELGKSQIAADFYTGLLPETFYRRAFFKHEKTAYTSRHAVIGDHEKVKHGFYIDNEVAKALERMRQQALYVDETNDPLVTYGAEDADAVIEKVERHHRAIEHAEFLNGRIGSKALFK